MRDLFVHGGKAITSVHEEDDDIGFVNGSARLLIYAVVDLRFFFAQEAAGIDDAAGHIHEARFAVVAVTGEAGCVGDEAVAAAGQGVKQGRFADVGATDQRHQRFAQGVHGVSL